ncbi:amino acid ABC transporter permease [Clostridium sp. WILCCON 0269]|uniref:Amino acid ABC transporter permease n=1 Tax=Candidatus Clostridium eludens TaxID=3381663 RepID=A0ABW8SH59_9CLOT
MGKLFDIRLVFEYLPQLLSRLHITLLIVLLATVIGIFLGMILALFRIYKIPILNQISIVYISFMRGTPIIVQMFIVYYGLPVLFMLIGIDINKWDKLFFVIITYGLNAAAFMAEVIRSAIISVSIGQTEAAYSVGMTRIQTFHRVVAPQALLIALPSLSTNMVGLLQDSSIAFSLGIIDVMGKAQTIGARTYHTLEGYIGSALIFLVLSILVEKGCTVIEKKVTYKKIIGDGR